MQFKIESFKKVDSLLYMLWLVKYKNKRWRTCASEKNCMDLEPLSNLEGAGASAVKTPKKAPWKRPF